MAHYARRAVEDLDEIWDYTFDRWGIDQAETYLDELRNKVALIESNPKLGRPVLGLSPPARVHPHGSHVILYREIDAEIRIERVLHARQNWQAILGG